MTTTLFGIDMFYVIALIKTAIVVGAMLQILAYLQWVERKVIAHVQVRPGPYRVGWHGLLQPLADVIKLITKEDMMPQFANRFFFLLAPFLSVFMALLAMAVIPFGPMIDVAGHQTYMEITNLNIAVLFILGISSMGVYGIALAGWSSNNKYSLLGGLRSSAQLISYELPMSIAIAAPLLLSNSLSLRTIVDTQAGSIIHWNVLRGPFPQIISFVVFMIAGFAETNRIPFDLPEAENELVAGFHTEYSSMKFASFFMAEYANMMTVSAMATILFLGGWMAPWPVKYGSSLVPSVICGLSGLVLLYHGANAVRKRDKRSFPVFGILFLLIAAGCLAPPIQSILMPLFWFCAKSGAILFVFMWIRATLPRFRYDQLMAFAWKFLFPVALLNLLVTGFMVAWFS